MKKIVLLLMFSFMVLFAIGQEKPVTWQIEILDNSDGLKIYADINPEWYIYGMNIEEGGPLPLILSFETFDQNLELEDVRFEEVKLGKKIYDEVFGMDVIVYTDKIEILCTFSPKTNVKNFYLLIDGQACNKKNGSCQPFFEKILVNLEK